MIPLRALVIGRDAGSASAGAEVRAWRGIDLAVPRAHAGRPLEACRLGVAVIDSAPLLWADVLVIRGPLSTVPACDACPFASGDEAAVLRHADATGHEWRRPVDAMVRGLVEAIDREPAILRGRGLVYEVGGVPAVHEADLDARLRRLADHVVEPGEAHADWRRAIAGPRAMARLAIRGADAELASILADRRDRGLPSWDRAQQTDPLVSVVIVAAGEPADAVERAIGSALDSHGVRIEVVVAGAAVAASVGDPRVRFVGATGDWAEAFVAALDAATGAWISPLDPASVFADGHVADLLGLALEHDLDVVYGQTLHVDAGEVVGVAGDWPPSAASLALDATLFAAPLRRIRPDPGAATEGDDPRWNLVRRWLEAGVRIANVEEPVTLRDLSVARSHPARPGDAA
jgi:hypothetical protein